MEIKSGSQKKNQNPMLTMKICCVMVTVKMVVNSRFNGDNIGLDFYKQLPIY
jgi:hypothetical protein